MRRHSILLFGLAVIAAASAVRGEERQRRVVADFEDAGTWRVIKSTGSARGAWFAGVSWMGGSRNARFADEWTGELRFHFAEDAGERRLVFRRAKMARVSGFLDGIEFDADSRGHPVSLRFVLLDAARKRHTTPPVRLGAAGWRRHRLELGPETWPAFDRVAFPAAVEQVVLEADAGGAGAVFIDDLALTGQFTRKDRLAISPVYSGINYEPGKPVMLDYRVRNAGGPLRIAGAVSVKTVPGGREVFAGRAVAEAGRHGQAMLRFELPPLPVGAYEAAVSAEGDGAGTTYDDTFGVFAPNGGRINRRPMWFGVQDQTMWQGEGENRLHLDWMRRLGIDLNRSSMTGGRFDPANELSLAGWRAQLGPFEQAGIDSVMLYFETPPALLPPGGNARMPANDLAAFERYAADVGSFFGAEFPRIRYVEFWNEPDIGFFHGTIEDYRAMFTAFSRGLRSTAPRLRLTTGGSTVKHPREKQGFSEALYSKDGDIYDVAAFHAHGPLPLYAERQRMVEDWQAAGGLEKPIANTESGDRSGYTARGRAEQAVTLLKKMVYSKSRPRSEFHVWFTLQDYWDMDPDVDDSFGLVTSDNRAKPAFVAYNEVIRQLANTDPAPASGLPEGVAGHAFSRDDGRHVLVCWAAEGSGGGVLWLRSEEPVQRVGLFGGTELLDLRQGGAILVGKEPFYLVFAGPPTVMEEAQRPLSAPAELYRDPREPAGFPVRVRNPGETRALHRLVVRDEAGGPVWSGEFTLAPGAESVADVRLPAAPDTGISTARLRVELTRQGEAEPLSLAVLVHGSHVISGRPEPLRLLTAQDVHELSYDPAIPAWRGPQDLAVEAFVGREAGAVVFRFNVADDRHVQTQPDDQLWRGDSVQVAFYNPENGAHTLFDLGLRGGEAVAWCHKNADPSLQGRWTVSATIRREGGITRYEARVPFPHLGLPASPAPGTPVRFSFLVNEDDGQGRVRWMRWRGGLGDNQDVQQLGHGILK